MSVVIVELHGAREACNRGPELRPASSILKGREILMTLPGILTKISL